MGADRVPGDRPLAPDEQALLDWYRGRRQTYHGHPAAMLAEYIQDLMLREHLTKVRH